MFEHRRREVFVVWDRGWNFLSIKFKEEDFKWKNEFYEIRFWFCNIADETVDLKLQWLFHNELIMWYNNVLANKIVSIPTAAVINSIALSMIVGYNKLPFAHL